jgi:hypothetical protein
VSAPVQYTTEDGVTVRTGDVVYDYYSMEVVRIGRDCGRSDGWFEVEVPQGGKRASAGVLNGQRICTMPFARRRDFPGARDFTE